MILNKDNNQLEKKSISQRILFQDFFLNSQIPMCILEIGGNIKDANPSFCRLTGYTQEDHLSMSIDDFLMSGSENKISYFLTKVFDDGGGFVNAVYLRKESGIVNIDLFLSPLKNKHEKILLMEIRETTNRQESMRIDQGKVE